MKKSKFLYSLPFKLLVSVALGMGFGLLLNFNSESAFTTAALNVIVTLKYILGQLINFCVPLIIIGFIAPSITQLGNNASRMLGIAVFIAYFSSLGAALFSTAAGYLLIPHLSIRSSADSLRSLPDVIFQLSIPQIMPVMSALVLAVMLGLASAWTKAQLMTSLLKEFQNIVTILAERYGVTMEKEELLMKANAWELSHGGLTGRTAQQFIDHILGTIEEKEK